VISFHPAAASKQFFFEKKNQKTFALLSRASGSVTVSIIGVKHHSAHRRPMRNALRATTLRSPTKRRQDDPKPHCSRIERLAIRVPAATPSA
jgi:hypothetical protein